MKYAIKYYNEICIIELAGKVDFIASQFLDKVIRDKVLNGNNNVIIDFSEIEYIGSSGLSVLINHLINCRENNGDLKLFKVNENILSMIKNIRLNDVFEIYNDLQKCQEAFSD
ncbi:MAG: hypothetical protein C0601_11980 [Candidatus Muiribacterium halophilum]|uniref:Anti-sigma factor antagonist n=1 Tax=Muiribacterium halophilum TaxID=2053465 RepID=A0A2N5ZAW0_MUIH1|nr:MAG: hypothetical protein C0601_11980 [Candidatus Muirbacterium halophilum]